MLEISQITVPILGSNISDDEIVNHLKIPTSLFTVFFALRVAVVLAAHPWLLVAPLCNQDNSLIM